MFTTRSRSMFASLVAALAVGFITVIYVTTQPTVAAGVVSLVAVDEDASLHDHMENVNDHLRAIMRGVSDPEKKAEVLEHVTQLQKHLLGAKMHAPPALEDQPAGERDAYALGFRKALAEVLVEAAKLEIDVLDDRAEDAVKRIRENMIDLRNAAHETYQVDDD